MQITLKVLPKSRREYLVKLTAVEAAEFFEAALKRLATGVKVTGFRPGKAPLDLVRSQIQPEKLREEAYSLAVHKAWHQVVEQLAAGGQKAGAKNQELLMPIEDPAVEILSFEEGKGGEFRFDFDIRPTVTVKDIKSIKLTGVKKTPVSDGEVKEVLNSLSKGKARFVIKLEAAQKGDKIEVSFDGYLKNVKQEKLSSKRFPLVLGEESVIPGFAEELIGLKKGDQKKFELTFPADHFDKTLAGQPVRFEVTVDEVFDVQLPPLDDQFAQQFGHDKLEELQAAIKADLQAARDEEHFTQQKAKWLAEFESKVIVDLPESLIRAEAERSKQSWRQFLQERHLNESDWLKSRDLTLESLEKDWRKAAEASVKVGLGLAEVARELKRELKTNDEFESLLSELVRQAISR